MSEAHDSVPRQFVGLRLVAAPVDVIDRARIFRRLDRATKRGVLLLHGYAGAGKSVLAHSWLVSRSYTDATSRWIDCSARTTPADVEEAFDALSGSELVRRRPPVVVIDQLDQVGPAVPDEILSIAARHRDVGLIVCSRGWPDMRIGQLSARGDLTVIGADELAFSADEVSQLWQLRRGTAQQASALRLWEFTRGWPVAVQIITSTLEARVDDPRLPALAGFYDEELLDPLDDDARLTLDAAALSPWSTPELITAVTGQIEAAPQVNTLSLAGLPLSWDELGRLVVHPALRRHLLIRQSTADPDRLTAFRRRAAVWMEEHGEELAALRLAVAAQDEAHAMRLLRQEFLRHLFSSTQELAEVLSSMPTTWRARHGYIPVLTALAHAVQAGTNLNAVLGVVMENLPPKPADPGVSLEALTLIGIRLAQRRMVQGEPDLGLEEADRLARLVPLLGYEQRVTLRPELALFYCQYGENLLMVGRLSEAKQALVAAHASAQLARLDWVALEANGSLALVEALIGEAVVADQIADQAIGFAERLGLSSSTLAGRAHLAKATVALLTCAGSSTLLEALGRFDACYRHQQPEFAGVRAHLEAMAALLAGDPVGALAVVDAYRRTHRSVTGSLAEVLLHMTAINCHLALDEIDQAQNELDRLHESAAVPELVAPEIFHARLQLRRGDIKAAWATILDQLTQSGPLHALPAVVQLRTAAVVAHVAGEHEQEIALSARATALAERAGMQPALLQAMAQGSVPTSTNPLTEAERLVLASLRPDDTIAAAATRMYVSVNTYKTHLRKSYRKLGVTSRDEAVAKARAYDWIPAST